MCRVGLCSYSFWEWPSVNEDNKKNNPISNKNKKQEGVQANPQRDGSLEDWKGAKKEGEQAKKQEKQK